MSDELDLEKGDPERADRIEGKTTTAKKPMAQQRAAGRPTAREKAKQQEDTEVKSRLVRVFNRIADMLERKGDEELAEAIADTAEDMTQGFVSLTRNVTFLRGPLLMLLNLVEPTLAFWKVGGILFGRWYSRRVMSAEEVQRIHDENAAFAASHAQPAAP